MHINSSKTWINLDSVNDPQLLVLNDTVAPFNIAFGFESTRLDPKYGSFFMEF
jgi:hypothetical protein